MQAMISMEMMMIHLQDTDLPTGPLLWCMIRFGEEIPVDEKLLC